MRLTNLFVHLQTSPTSTTAAIMVNPIMFQPINASSPLPTLKPHFQAAPAPPPYPLSPTKAFGSGPMDISNFSYPHVTPSHPQAPEHVVISDSGMSSNFAPCETIQQPQSHLYSAKPCGPSEAGPAYHPLPLNAELRHDPSAPLMDYLRSGMPPMGTSFSSGRGFPLDQSAAPADPADSLAGLRGEMLGRFQGVSEGYEALYRELYEARRRQDVLVDLCGRMYRSLQVLTNGSGTFLFTLAAHSVAPISEA